MEEDLRLANEKLRQIEEARNLADEKLRQNEEARILDDEKFAQLKLITSIEAFIKNTLSTSTESEYRTYKQFSVLKTQPCIISSIVGWMP